MSIGEYWAIKNRLALDFFVEARRYYPKSIKFMLADFLLFVFSLFANPYRLARKRGEVYGETPLTTFHKIFDFCHLSKEDVWLDLGSGRGRGCFWISSFIGCKTLGVEKIGWFVAISRLIAKILKIEADFECKEMSAADFSKASVVYLYGTCLSDSEIGNLMEKMKALPSGAKVISISEPLPGWGAKSFPVSFPWGETEAFLHVKK